MTKPTAKLLMQKCGITYQTSATQIIVSYPEKWVERYDSWNEILRDSLFMDILKNPKNHIR